MNVVCIGSGYVGSVTGTAFAVLGHPTTVIDIDPSKIDLLNAGKSPIYEPGLDQLVRKYIGKTLFATTSYQPVHEADVVFIGVGTPSKQDGTADLTYIKKAAELIGAYLHPHRFTVVVNKSTVPVGTADLVTAIIEEASGLKAGEHFSVVSNPEFLREGYALEDVFFPDRIVVGSNHERAKNIMRELYHRLVERVSYEEISKDFAFPYNPLTPKAVYFETDVKSAEMIKYASNAFLAVKISYINEVARLCETLGANVLDVARGMGLDSRIGGKFLQVSSGWSGSCFPKDTAEFLQTSRKYGTELSIVKAAIESNRKMHEFVVEKIRRRLKILNGKKIGILGLTFKPNTDDARQTQASVIIQMLLDLGANIRVHDPKGMEMFKAVHPHLHVQYCASAEDVAHQADGIVLLTHWNEYLQLDWKQMLSIMKTPYLLDTRNFLPKKLLIGLGYQYEGLGIGTEQEIDGGIMNQFSVLSV
ncbi:UDP-glucose dehydrogenase family protein [Lihuaxuella thermophila]|uniref:UDP-glucose 6-dehydrogenase n=1 Tax=Lihuaxuella thermophila TaxID=1173111 RepID=A0A1H8CH64_9BACL|nr:UDP-glucose/GDP-mannose dehydrogenase family protein [Lihuaxuella thermophila]SEM93427.1 UDPglucose 6-dehydrogenase [Lihuaxuella thermophila]